VLARVSSFFAPRPLDDFLLSPSLPALPALPTEAEPQANLPSNDTDPVGSWRVERHGYFVVSERSSPRGRVLLLLSAGSSRSFPFQGPRSSDRHISAFASRIVDSFCQSSNVLSFSFSEPTSTRYSSRRSMTRLPRFPFGSLSSTRPGFLDCVGQRYASDSFPIHF